MSTIRVALAASISSLREHNPAQSLPLPPVGFENAPTDRASCPTARE